MNHPADRHYANTHEWLILDDLDIATIGISDYAQQALGDVVHASLPAINDQVTAGQACCVLESVKAASDVHAPISGTIVAINPQLSDSPELINDSVYSDGWLFKIQPQTNDISHLMTAADYETTLD